MNIAILGYGTIGSGVYDIISKSSNFKDLKVIKILDLPIHNHNIDIITYDINDIIDNQDIDLVVETIGGIYPAYDYIINCLKAKKHVVSANKAVICKYLKEFVSVSKDNNVSFMFEASVGGGIPWLNNLIRVAKIDDINYFYGIFNGTSNFILDYMYSKNKDFNDALALAKQYNYAEACPKADISGYDIANKVCISGSIAFNSYLDSDDFCVYPMGNISFNDINYFKDKGYIIKYIGEAKRVDNLYEAFIMLNILKVDSLEANTKVNNNIISLYGDHIKELKFYGEGAGKEPTASAIILDILDIKDNINNLNIDSFSIIEYSDNLSLNKYLIRYNNIIDYNDSIESIDKYYNDYYIITKLLTLRDFRLIFNDILNDQDNILVFKYKDIN